MSQRLERRIGEWAKWYTYHRPYVERSGDLGQYARFYGVAIDGMFELLAESALRIQKLEKADRPEIVLPNGVVFHDAMRAE